MLWGLLLQFLAQPVSGFAPSHGVILKGPQLLTYTSWNSPHFRGAFLLKSNKKEDDEEEGIKNPYNDPNYPDLEFVDYSNPDYAVDQGVTDEFFDPSSTEAQIEEMREDRRRRNDEYQFQTYFKELLSNGREYKGIWSVYQTSTFMQELKDNPVDAVHGLPRLIKSSRPLYVTSKAYKSTVETTSIHPTDAERIQHVETVATNPANNDEDDDDETTASPAEEKLNQSILQSTYWPEQLSALDFRGDKAIMCVGAAYTICNCISEAGEVEDGMEGPFAEYRAEMGIIANDLRLRVKLDYQMTGDAKRAFIRSENVTAPPPLCLKSMVVCREVLERWPPGPNDEDRSATEEAIARAFYGKPGAEGGLYDPPPVGSEEQAGKYMLLDLEGGATLLFPYEMEQDPRAFEGNGWVTSLDWTPGNFRYQVDRKILGGRALRTLRTLELSEVQGADADQYRPRDGK
jgi:hypothetical protein